MVTSNCRGHTTRNMRISTSTTFLKKPRAEFYKYEIGVDLLYDIPIEDLLDIFARINTFTVRLNAQEQLNAKYLGYFKQYAYRIGLRYVQYFMDGGVLTHAQVSRMKEAESSSPISLLASLEGYKLSRMFHNIISAMRTLRTNQRTCETLNRNSTRLCRT